MNFVVYVNVQVVSCKIAQFLCLLILCILWEIYFQLCETSYLCDDIRIVCWHVACTYCYSS